MKQSTDFFVMCRAHLAFYPFGYKFKNKAPQAASFANNVVIADASLDESVNLTRSEYQQLLGLLNSHSHFGTQATPGGGSDTHQVANIITQPTQSSFAL